MNHWQNKPFVRIIIPFILGIWLATHALMAGLMLLSASIVIVAWLWTKFSVFHRSQALRNILFLCTIGIAGYCLTYANDERLLPDHYSRVESIQRAQGTIIRIQQQKTWDRWVVRLSAVEIQDRCWQKATGKVQLFVKHGKRPYQISDRIIFEGGLQPIAAPKNPLEFDYQSFSQFKHIHQIAFLYEEQVLLHKRPDFTVKQWAFKSRKKLSSFLDQLVPSMAEAGIAKALILGDRSQIDGDIIQIFQQTGAMHILAVSGLHVGIVYLLLSFIFNWIPQNNRFVRFLRLLLILTGIWAFALISGLSMAVVRASVMFSFISIGSQWFMRSNIYNTLALSAFIILMHDPYSIYEVGFQLSYAAMLSILFFYPKIIALMKFKYKLMSHLWQVFAIGMAAQILTLPFLAYYFHQYSLGFILSNIVVMPFAFLILTLGWMGLALFPILPLLAANMGFILQGILGLMYEILTMISHLSWLQIEQIYLSKTDLVIWLCMLIFILSSIYYQSKQHFFVSIALFTLMQSNISFRHIDNNKTMSCTIFDAKKPLISFGMGPGVYQYTHPNLKEKQIQRITQNAYIARDIQQITPVKSNRILAFRHAAHEYKAIIIDHPMQIQESIDMAVLIDIQPQTFLHLFCDDLPNEIIYLNTSKTFRDIAMIRQFCKSQGILFKEPKGYFEQKISF